jgi:hypothetical protein
MRYLLLLTTEARAAPAPAPAPTPSPDVMLQRFTIDLIHAGVLLAGELLAEDRLLVELSAGGSCTIEDAPMADASATALWIVQAANRAEAVEWARRVPLDRGRVEVRRIVSGAAAEA